VAHLNALRPWVGSWVPRLNPDLATPPLPHHGPNVSSPKQKAPRGAGLWAPGNPAERAGRTWSGGAERTAAL